MADTQIGLIGLETPSVNPQDYEVIHKVILEKRIIILEGLVNVCKIPCEEFTLIALPLKVRNGDGSPVRAIGVC